MHLFMIAAAAATLPPASPDDGAIIVTASREPLSVAEAPLSVTTFDGAQLEALNLPAAPDLLRLVPGLSVSVGGPRSAQAQVRIRGAEANHSLLFVDGIRFNDPAASNEARFELLSADFLSRIEVIRGPQSALWGSEALGGVVAVETADPFSRTGIDALAEYGSLQSFRAGAQATARLGEKGLGITAARSGSEGIDSFGGGGEKDGYDQLSLGLKAITRPAAGVELGLAGHWIELDAQFDGIDLATFTRQDTLDETENRIGAIGAWLKAERGLWRLTLDASYLDSANHNRQGSARLNSAFGDRWTLGAQLSREFAGHRITLASAHEEEGFHTARQAVFGAPDQDRKRGLTALVGEWRGDWSETVSTGLAVRHDDFSAFENATTFRATILVNPADGWKLHAGYGEGIAQPNFYELYGFSPAFFIGNPDLKPERSRGWEAGIGWNGASGGIGVTAFSNALQDEIVGTFDPVTFLSSTANADRKSRRRGIEAEGRLRLPGSTFFLVNYTFLNADEPAAGGRHVREVRRPRHSANAAVAGEAGKFGWGVSLAYVGERADMNFDLFPAVPVTLDDYALASFNLTYRPSPKIEAFVRAENAFDVSYQDVFGYFTPGRTVHAGLRFRTGG